MPTNYHLGDSTLSQNLYTTYTADPTIQPPRIFMRAKAVVLQQYVFTSGTTIFKAFVTTDFVIKIRFIVFVVYFW